MVSLVCLFLFGGQGKYKSRKKQKTSAC